MTILEMLGQSGILTLLGMGVVFVFLILLVTTISLAGKFFSGNDQDMAASNDKMAASPAAKDGIAGLASAGTNNNDRMVAAISAAITEYRKQN